MVAGFCLCVWGCEKGGVVLPSSSPEGGDISFRIAATTKSMTDVTTASITGFSVTAVDPSGTPYFENERTIPAPISGCEMVDGKTWGESNLSFYAVYPYTEMTLSEGRCDITAGTSSGKLTGDEDIVAVKVLDITRNTPSIPLTFEHILGCLNTVEVKGDSADCRFTVTSMKIGYPRYGTYNLLSGSWSSLGEKEERSLSLPADIMGGDSTLVNPVLSLIPGMAVFTIDYNVVKDGITVSRSKSAELYFNPGYKSKLKVNLSGDFKQTKISATLNPWGSSSSDADMVGGGYLYLTPARINVTSSAVTESVSVECDGEWTATGYPSWVTLSKTSGNGDSSVSISIAANTDEDTREAVITFTRGEQTRVLTIMQNGSFDAQYEIGPYTDRGSYEENL